MLSAQTAMQLVLILHELATNAEKFGALSDTCGRLDVSWEDVRGEPGKVEIEWKESGGPRVSPPKSKGFGLSLIESSKNLPYLVMNMDFEPTGLICRMKIDADRARTHKARLFLVSRVACGKAALPGLHQPPQAKTVARTSRRPNARAVNFRRART